MELAGADDKDGKPDSGELSGESESNAATIFDRTQNLRGFQLRLVHRKPLTMHADAQSWRLCRRIH
jgi:hypothetical protein